MKNRSTLWSVSLFTTALFTVAGCVMGPEGEPSEYDDYSKESSALASSTSGAGQKKASGQCTNKCMAGTSKKQKSGQTSATGTLRDTTLPGTGVVARVSADGDQLFVGQGASVSLLDLTTLRSSVLNGQGSNLDTVTLTTIPIEASVMDVVDNDGTIYVAGGDFGLFSIDSNDAVSVHDASGGGRWCFDLHIAQGHLFALWAAKDRTQLRVYRLSDGSLYLSQDVTRSTGVKQAANAYAVDVLGDYAYLAMGKAGIVRLNWRAPTGLVEQGPDFFSTGSVCHKKNTLEQCDLQYRARDLAIAGDYLYVAADRKGLVEIDLRKWSGSNTPYWSQRPHGLACNKGKYDEHYPVRVDAVLDEDVSPKRIVVAVGALGAPSAKAEWGPYYRFTTFTWDLDNVNDVGKFPKSSCDGDEDDKKGLFIYDKHTDGPPPSLQYALNHPYEQQRWKSVSIHKANERYWIYDQRVTVWHLERDGSGLLLDVQQEPEEAYTTPRVSYVSPKMSLNDPNLVLCSADGYRAGSTPQIYRIDTDNSPTFVPVPGTATPDFQMNLLLGAQWREPENSWEWVTWVQGGIGRFRTAPGVPNLIASTFQHWVLPLPDDPEAPPPGSDKEVWEHPSGRGYGTAAVDGQDGDGLLAVVTSMIPRGVSLWRREDIIAAVATPPAPGAEINVAEIGQLNVHPEAGCSPRLTVRKNMQTMHSTMFLWTAGSQAHRVLAVAAGRNPKPEHMHANRAKVVFFDLDDCVGPNAPCTALHKGNPCDYVDPNVVSIHYLPDLDALAWGIDIATVGGRQYAFVSDSVGRVSALALHDLFGGGATLAGQWRMPRAIYDRKRTVLTEIQVVLEAGPDGTPHAKAWVAANRAGVIKLAIHTDEQGGVTFEVEDWINTPGQAGGLEIRNLDLGGPEPVQRMLVGDHDESGIKVYGE